MNDEATYSEDVEVQEVRPIGRDRATKGPSSASRSASSAAADSSLLDVLLNKFTKVATTLFSSRKESSSEYLRIQKRELEMRYLRRRE
nr:hypothetical protein [Tanacetum cinerariifolium]